MKTAVIKFGGSSLGTPEKINLSALKIKKLYEEGLLPVAVVSAPADCTDDLLGLASEVSPRCEARELDALQACGEQISAALVAMAVNKCGLRAVSLTGPQAGIITDGNFGKARVTALNGGRLAKETEDGKIVIVAGFQGVSAGGDITTLGRGGSDFTAVYLARALGSEKCVFYTDVKGIYSAHPALVPEAKVCGVLSYGEVMALAEAGTEVRQFAAIRFAAENKLNLVLRSSFSDDNGTVVNEMGEKGLHCFAFSRSADRDTVYVIGNGIDSGVAGTLAAAEPFLCGLRAEISEHSVRFTVPSGRGETVLRRLHAVFIESH